MPDAEKGAAGEEPAPDAKPELEQLRELLVGHEQRELRELRERFDRAEVTAEDVQRVLPDAVLLRSRSDDQLSEALTPTIEGAIEGSVRRNPQALADAIFPVIGPAIRKSIREAMSSLLESINRTVEHSLSPTGIRWRLEAARTGRPFAEIVLKHSLVYRIEQVFLIHAETALLLEHVVAPTVATTDPEMVSSMLGAIQDFVSDSFSAGERDIQTVEFGELTLQVASGPHALVACVVRGISPPTLREEMQQTVEDIHASRSKDLRVFGGDVAPFVMTRPSLQGLLVEQRAEKEKKKNRVGPAVLMVAVPVVVLGLAIWAFNSYHASRRWSGALDALLEEPGVVVIEADLDDGVHRIRGLRDAAARDPLELLQQHGIAAETVDARWEPYHALEPSLVVRRARTALAPPDSVQMELRGETLVVWGRADHAWIERAEAEARFVVGVTALDLSTLIDEDAEAARSRAGNLSNRSISFAPGSARLDYSYSRTELSRFCDSIDELVDTALFAGLRVRVVVHGGKAANEDDPRLAAARAEAVREWFEERYFGATPAHDLVVSGSEAVSWDRNGVLLGIELVDRDGAIVPPR